MMSYSIRVKLSDRNSILDHATNVGSYTSNIDGDYMDVGTESKEVFSSWTAKLKLDGVWFESTPKV